MLTTAVLWQQSWFWFSSVQHLNFCWRTDLCNIILLAVMSSLAEVDVNEQKSLFHFLVCSHELLCFKSESCDTEHVVVYVNQYFELFCSHTLSEHQQGDVSTSVRQTVVFLIRNYLMMRIMKSEVFLFLMWLCSLFLGETKEEVKLRSCWPISSQHQWKQLLYLILLMMQLVVLQLLDIKLHETKCYYSHHEIIFSEENYFIIVSVIKHVIMYFLSAASCLCTELTF